MGRAGRWSATFRKVSPMKTVWRFLQALGTSEDAATATEYAFMLGFIVMVAVASISGMGNGVSNAFATLTASIPVGGGS